MFPSAASSLAGFLTLTLTLTLTLIVIISVPSQVSAAIIPSHDRNSHDHVSQDPLPDRCRQVATPTDPSSFPQVGTPAWAAAYPSFSPDSNAMPQPWKDALNTAIQAGKIPNFPPSVQNAPGTSPSYPSLNPSSPQVCSATSGCRIAGQVWDPPQGVLALSFDDGPLPPSDKLYAFLQQNQVKATHFFIGVNIIQNWKEFNLAFQTNQDDIAVHTWTHPYMTTLSNADVVAQLGWTLQVIYNSTGGRLARFWRPPYGDTDARVTAIAKEVFGLTTVVWNRDTADWTLGLPGGTSPQAIQANFQNWLSGPRTPGLMILEHELSPGSVQAFMTAFPLIKQSNWTIKSVAELDGQGAYQNVENATGQPTPVSITAGGNGGAGLISPTSSSSSSTQSRLSITSSSSQTSSSASAAPNNGVKKSSGTPRLHASHLTLSAYALALTVTLCLI
ncbi:glycoside hydrolase/deacetylase [Multifurca ochricompacta]|uniref:chitin deacetylase n=1 Tax=Multifurca ochricompacta TaxID=376703 RepID=A0AAD4MB08_9AGAM|nr:glycoside hydrolase/deacetylase [Multifurca ochricompacta]